MGNYHGGVLLWTCFILCCITYTVHGQCPASQFACKNGNCIQMTWRCDEDDDCGDNSDEDNCGPKTCPGNNFQCANGKCIPERWHCDRDKDCQDGSDETPQDCEVKQCNDNEFTCGDKACIPSQWRCDLQKDCQDGSDEEKCERKCPDNEFGCKNGKCISNHWTCDQEDDCGDRSDEENCPNVNCSAGEVMCGDRKRCILERWLCDGDNDCRDKSDETNCTSTRKSLCDDSEFMCKNVPGECISLGWHCDGDQDCSDGSDEPADCKVTCKPTDFFCRISKYCIKGIYECNGRKDCLDGSDEDHCMNTTRSCGPEEFDCNGEGVFCIAKEKVCDGINDCGEFEDELVDPVRCRKSDPCETANCAHRCVNMHKTAKCQCHHGFKLGADNRSCEDIDECEINGICSQICINKKGHYTCACMDGYALENHRFCKAKVRPSLIFTNKKDVRKIMIGRRTYLTLVTNTSSAVALDYNYNTNHLYWSDVALEKIQRASIDGTGVESVVEEDIRTPDGLAIDWIHNLLYWTDTGKDTIEVMDLNTRHRRILFSENITEPRAIVLDPIEGWMYWTDWGTTPKIERSGMNGGQRSEIVSSPYDLEWPNGLALDHVGRRLYWNDAKLHLIASIKLDGSDMRIVKTDPALIRHPFALTVFEDSVYWTDWASESIQAVNKFTGENEVIALELKSPMDIHIYHPYGQPAGKNRCGSNNGGCAHLCLPAPHISSQSAHYTCVCRDGFVENKNDSTQCVAVGTIQGPSSKKPSQNTSVNSTPKPTGQWVTVDLSNTATSGHGYTIQPQDNATDSNENQAINKTAEDKEGGSIALIAICICVALAVLLAVAGVFVYKRFIVQSKKTMNFDNPVYRKTTEEQFIIEKGGSSASIPSTMQPLTTENEYA